MPIRGAVLIAGPTASGKSALALATACRLGGVVVNADSMQVYDGLQILTARPTQMELATAPHLLYGHVDPRNSYSTGAWLRDVAAIAESGLFNKTRPVFVGGTGLYFKALLEGLSTMPDVPDDIRNAWRRRLAEEGAPALHRILATRDQAAAATIRSNDGQRIVRALEVFDASGRSIREWQGDRGPALADASSATRILIEPDREELARRIDRRFDLMIEAGALHEARTFSRLGVSPALPAAKAIGLRELVAAEQGAMEFAAAIERAKIATKQYAKRQMTWFRNQLGSEWERRSLSSSQ